MKVTRVLAPPIVVVAVVVTYALWPRITNIMLPPDNRPADIDFAPEKVTAEEFDAIARRLTELTGPGLADRARQSARDFPHIERFRKKGILAYEGPKTCLRCHAIAYDMNRKQVFRDGNGRLRWGQDRSLRAAMSVARPTAQNCLRHVPHSVAPP